MNNLDHWRLCEELSVIQAVFLILGSDPSDREARPIGFDPVFAALTNAVVRERIPATVRHSGREYSWAEVMIDVEAHGGFGQPEIGNDLEEDEELIDGNSWVVKLTPDWELTTIPVDSLREWLKSRPIPAPAFFATSSSAPDYLDPQHPRYASKLAAAVCAWRAVQAEPMKGKSPKQLLAKWLRENAAQFDMTDEDGKPFEEAVENCAKVANWQPGGGAPKTPTG